MKAYKSLKGSTGVLSYQIEDDLIKVKFKDGDTYVYNYQVTGMIHVEKMKVRALSGNGLSTYITKYVKEKYAFKY